MIILGIILIIIGLFFHPLIFLGVIILIVGAVLAILGATGRAIGGRKHWY